MSNSRRIKDIIDFCNENDIEIVSYGIAPNPNGFCYELFGDSCRDEARCLDEMLDGLTSEESKELRRIVFGGIFNE